jgi:hypothetical protein
MVNYTVVGKMQYFEIHRFQMQVSFSIVIFLLVMDFPIDLDDERRRMAVKINDKPVDDLLTVEVISPELVGSNRRP